LSDSSPWRRASRRPTEPADSDSEDRKKKNKSKRRDERKKAATKATKKGKATRAPKKDTSGASASLPEEGAVDDSPQHSDDGPAVDAQFANRPAHYRLNIHGVECIQSGAWPVEWPHMCSLRAKLVLLPLSQVRAIPWDPAVSHAAAPELSPGDQPTSPPPPGVPVASGVRPSTTSEDDEEGEAATVATPVPLEGVRVIAKVAEPLRLYVSPLPYSEEPIFWSPGYDSIVCVHVGPGGRGRQVSAPRR
jgi:hypothetical protein